MKGMRNQVKYAVTMKIDDWTYVEGTMDNDVQSARDRGWRQHGRGQRQEPYWRERAKVGETVQKAGWRQLPRPAEYEELQRWGASGRTVSIKLTGQQWSVVVSALERWANVDDELEDAEGAGRSRSIAAMVENQLAQQGTQLERPPDRQS
ncbi:hypothetical protein [Actinoplanes auranticolor]|uniref:Uncharacterized protein n=1 Tax=Actinoplanes auranticolor TaxID=47988 RepID=A0A919S7I7_9ACTN|nr:hypothetical protein [Actinoplanes auranticolor]GIM65969.1 hypothetical protein Aau02nite_21000 [Actinoplanes auranticolor]